MHYPRTFTAILVSYLLRITAAIIHVDTNILSKTESKIRKILEYLDGKNVGDPKYKPVENFFIEEGGKGKEFFEQYKVDKQSADYTILWDFFVSSRQDLVNSGLYNQLEIDDIQKFAIRQSNPEEQLFVNAVTKEEYFHKRSFKISPKSSKPKDQNRIDFEKIMEEIFKCAPNLKIVENPEPFQIDIDIPSKVNNQKVSPEEIRNIMNNFWKKIANPDYSPKPGSYGAKLKKFNNNFLEDATETEKFTKEIVTTAQYYYKLKQAIQSSYKLLQNAKFAKVSRIDAQPPIENLDIILSINKEKDLDKILEEFFIKKSEQFDVGDLLFLLEGSANAGDKIWTYNNEMLAEIFEYHQILNAIFSTKLKLKILVKDRYLDIDFSTHNTFKQSIFLLFEPHFNSLTTNLRKIFTYINDNKIYPIQDSEKTLKDIEDRFKYSVNQDTVNSASGEAINNFFGIMSCIRSNINKPTSGSSRSTRSTDECKLYLKEPEEGLEKPEDKIIEQNPKLPAPCEGKSNCIDVLTLEQRSSLVTPDKFSNEVTPLGTSINNLQLLPMILSIMGEVKREI